MKEFNLEEAKAGKPVCTRNGRNVHFFKFDARGKFPILGYIEYPEKDLIYEWTDEGKCSYQEDVEDLMMVSEKHEGWINIIKKSSELSGYDLDGIYISENDAKEEGEREDNYITTIHVEWEE